MFCNRSKYIRRRRSGRENCPSPQNCGTDPQSQMTLFTRLSRAPTDTQYSLCTEARATLAPTHFKQYRNGVNTVHRYLIKYVHIPR